MAVLGLLVLTAFLCVFILVYGAVAISSFWGIPFVPTSRRQLKNIWSCITPRQTDTVIDLGSGDGTVVFHVARLFHAHAIGYEVNPLLYWWCVFRAKITGNALVQFKRSSMYDADLSGATIVYLFLFPEALEKLEKHIFREKRELEIVSHGFRMKNLERYEWLIMLDSPFKTYYYRIPAVLRPGGEALSREKR